MENFRRYSLGDSDPFDKFVIKVATDKRFGLNVQNYWQRFEMPSGAEHDVERNWDDTSVKASSGMNNKFISLDLLHSSTSSSQTIAVRETVNYAVHGCAWQRIHWRLWR